MGATAATPQGKGMQNVSFKLIKDSNSIFQEYQDRIGSNCSEVGDSQTNNPHTKNSDNRFQTYVSRVANLMVDDIEKDPTRGGSHEKVVILDKQLFLA